MSIESVSDIMVLGGGVAGISAGFHAGLCDRKATIYEAKERYGGLLDNFSGAGFRFDNAVHLSFTTSDVVRQIFDQAAFLTHFPEPVSFDNGLWLKHPIQNNLFNLPVDDRVKAVKDFICRVQENKDANYEQWLISTFGSYIAKHFYERFTLKYWTMASEKLNTGWIENRLYSPALEEVLRGAMTDDTPNTYYAKEMRYPKYGGYRSFIEPMAHSCDIALGKKAVTVDLEKKYVVFSDGVQEYYEKIISTIPLPELIKIIKDAPSDVVAAAENLHATSIALVSLGFNVPDIAKHLWFYIYDKNILPARVNSPGLKSPDNVPAGCSSLQFEVYYSDFLPLQKTGEELVDHIIKFLHENGIASKDVVSFIDYRTLKYGNVIFTYDIFSSRKIITHFLEKHSIYPAGRFGEWGYLWSDEALLSGKRAMQNICTP